MKKILKISLYGLLILLLVVLTVIHLLYVTFSPDDKGVEVIHSNLIYFQESYDDCRDAYLKEAQKVVGQYDQAELFSVRVPSEKDDGLFIDFLHLPPLQNSGKLLVISSGVHGVEGYYQNNHRKILIAFYKQCLASLRFDHRQGRCT